MRHLGFVLRAIVLSGLLITPVSAQFERLIPFQGRLVDEAGNPRNGSYKVTFTIWDAPANGVDLWSEVHDPAQGSGVSVNNGVMNVILGSIQSLDGISFEAPRYLEITVGNGQPMFPRHQLIPAFHARTAESADLSLSLDPGAIDAVATANIRDEAITNQKLGDGAVTSGKLANGSVGSDQIADGSVAVADLDPAIQATLGQAVAAPLVVNARITLGVGISLTSTTVSEIGDASLTLANEPSGNTAALIPCAPPTTPSGVNCGTSQERVGVSFVVARSGWYEACVTMELNPTAEGLRGDSRNNSRARFELQETDDVGNLVGPASPRVVVGNINNMGSLSGPVNQVTVPMTVCQVFRFDAPGRKTIRVRYKNLATNELGMTTTEPEGSDIHWWVKELR